MPSNHVKSVGLGWNNHPIPRKEGDERIPLDGQKQVGTMGVSNVGRADGSRNPSTGRFGEVVDGHEKVIDGRSQVAQIGRRKVVEGRGSDTGWNLRPGFQRSITTIGHV